MSLTEGEKALEELASLAEADADYNFQLRAYFPHGSFAISSNILQVIGDRGAGKSAFFRALLRLKEGEAIGSFFQRSVPPGTWLDAFSESFAHPDVGLIEKCAKDWSDVDLRAFWVAQLGRCLYRELKPPFRPPEVLLPPSGTGQELWMKQAPAVLSDAFAFLDRIEEWLASQQRQAVALYDHLDRLAPTNPEIRRRCIGSLLSLWLTLDRRFQWLRGKLFLRQDLFSQAEAGNPDLSKQRSRQWTLQWEEPALYGLLLRQLVALPSFQPWVQQLPELSWEDSAYGPVPGKVSDHVIRELCTRLCGRAIGNTPLFRAPTWRWLASRVEDGRGRKSPRSLLLLLGEAAKSALGADEPGLPLQGFYLEAGLKHSSSRRLAELKDEFPNLIRSDNLIGQRFPLPEATILELIGRPILGEPEGLPPASILLQEYVEIGLLARLGGQRLEIPSQFIPAFRVPSGKQEQESWSMRGERIHVLQAEAELAVGAQEAELRRELFDLAFEGLHQSGIGAFAAQLWEIIRGAFESTRRAEIRDRIEAATRILQVLSPSPDNKFRVVFFDLLRSEVNAPEDLDIRPLTVMLANEPLSHHLKLLGMNYLWYIQLRYYQLPDNERPPLRELAWQEAYGLAVWCERASHTNIKINLLQTEQRLRAIATADDPYVTGALFWAAEALLSRGSDAQSLWPDYQERLPTGRRPIDRVRRGLWSAHLYLGRGVASSSLADLDEARTRIDEALLYHPQYLPARRLKAAIYGQLAKIEPDYHPKARAYAEETERWWPGSASWVLAILAASKQDEGACQGWLNKALVWGRTAWKADLETAPELDPYRDRPWFQDLLARW